MLLSLRSSPALEAVLDGAREAVDGDLILRRVAPESGLRFEAETLAKAETAAPVPEVMEAVRFVYPERDETRLPKKLSVSQILRQKRENFWVINAGDRVDHPYWDLEKRAGDLYGLFAVGAPEPPGAEENRRVVYVR